jgi:uncharacterized protein YndB with AHSA1/START domain
MTTTSSPTLAGTQPSDREIVLSRVFRAPRELVWRAWTEAEQVGRWFGPDGFSITTHEMDVRPGGVWRFTMHGPDGAVYPNRVTYREVERPDRLVYDHDDDGASEQSFVVTVTFEAEGEGTRATMRMLFPTPEARDATVRFGAVELGKQTLRKLGELVERESGARAVVTAPGDREVRVERVFGAPRERVWRAFTEPEQVARWWGRGNRVVIERMEVERGGHWRFVEHADGEAHGFEGRYREVTPPERLVYTFEWDGMPGHVVVDAVTFEALGEDRTRVVTVSLFHTPEERDGMLSSGMEAGLQESYAALDRLLAGG